MVPAVRLFLRSVRDSGSVLVAVPESGRLSIGRARDCDVPVDDPLVSRRHAIVHGGPEPALEDLGSENGTTVRRAGTAVRLTPARRFPLAAGDVLVLGGRALVVHAAGPATARLVASEAEFEARLAAACANAGEHGGRLAVLRVLLTPTADPGEVQAVFYALTDAGAHLVCVAPGARELALVSDDPNAAEALRRRAVAELAARAIAGDVGLAVYPGDGTSAVALLAAASPAKTMRAALPPATARPAAAPGRDGREVVVLDEAMVRLHELATRAAESDINVLVLGETGVGKDVLAETIHARSARSSGPLLRLNCAALAESLLESELFGHERGAFTGADRAKPGLLETAAGGTVFLDEIGELPRGVQAKLLLVLEERRVLRVGGVQARPLDVRFIAATNRDLAQEIERGAFRRDLYFRIAGIVLRIPPLRERPGEIVALAEAFLLGLARREGRLPPALTEDARAKLRRHAWPGNVRELRNAVDRAYLLYPAGPLTADRVALEDAAPSTPPPTPSPPPPPSPPPTPSPAAEPDAAVEELKRRLAAAERERIIDALARCGGNQSRAARELGISRRTLITRIEQLGLVRPRKDRPRDG